MDNFRRRNRDDHRRALDGVLNSSAHPPGMPAPRGGWRRTVRFEGLRSTNSKLDDFKRPEGFHSSQAVLNGPLRAAHPLADSSSPAPKADTKTSLLHMTLPSGGTLAEPGKKNKSKSKKSGPHSRWRIVRKWSLRSALALTVLALVTSGFLLFKGILKINKVFKGGGAAAALEGSDVKPELLKGEGDGRVNIVLFGKGGLGHDGADLTDTIIVASIDPLNKTTTLVSIPRDLWVTVPGYGSMKINAVYANAKNHALSRESKDKEAAEEAGVATEQQVISQVLGIPIHYYGMVDFAGFKQAVDVVGGVDIVVPPELAVKETLWDEASGRSYHLDVPAGPQHFDSMRALYFTRSRHTSPRGDFDRAERQRLFIQALSQKVLSAGTYTNPVKISQLMSAFGDHMSTDLSTKNALRLVEIGKGMDLSKLASIGLADPPNNYVRTDNVNGQSVVRPTAGFGDYSEIQNYIRNTLKDPYLAKEDAKLIVLNGTSVAGLATKKSDELKSYGYNITGVGDAPTQTYTQTILVDLTGGKKPYTRNYLEKRLELKTTTQLPDQTIQAQGADFVIILGQNE